MRESVWKKGLLLSASVALAVVLAEYLLTRSSGALITEAPERGVPEKAVGWERILVNDPHTALSEVVQLQENESESVAVTEEIPDIVPEALRPGNEETSSAWTSALEQELLETTEKHGGTTALYFKNTVTEEEIILNDTPMVSASLIKLYVAGAYYAAVRDDSIGDTMAQTVRIMLEQSDNDACNLLIDTIGIDEINGFIQENGYIDTLLTRRMLAATGTENYTSVRDCGRLLGELLEESYVDRAASRVILDALKNQERRGKIPAGVPEGVITANKTGELSGIENDAAILWIDDTPCILVIMTDGVSDAVGEIRELAALVCKHVKERPERDGM